MFELFVVDGSTRTFDSLNRDARFSDDHGRSEKAVDSANGELELLDRRGVGKGSSCYSKRTRISVKELNEEYV
jgi:hypothetical protein